VCGQGLRPVQTWHINNGILSGMYRSRNPIVEVLVPLQLVQYAVGRLDEYGRSARMHMYEEEDGQEHKHDEDSQENGKEARGESA